VRVFIDKPEGVTLEDCERAHKALGPALDVADPFPHAYTLEVSSPGLDRPFKRLQDYRRAIGKRVTVKLREPLAGQWRLVGTLTDVADQTVTLAVDDRPTVRVVTLEQRLIAEAKRAVTW
jgi:ribosome maturation factor RimP